MPFPYGAPVVAGTNAVADDHNSNRKDGMTRFLKFEVSGPVIVADKVGGSFLMPTGGTFVKSTSKVSADSCTYRIEVNGSAVNSGISASTSVGSDTSFDTPAFSAGDLVTIDVTGISGSPLDLVVQIEILLTP